MKKRFDYFLETTQFPLVVLFTAMVLLGCGNLLVNSQVAIFWSKTNTIVQFLSAFLRLSGSFIIQIFPLIILVYATQKKMDDPVAGVLGAITYFFLLITTMFTAPTSLPTYAYTKIFGLTIDSSLFSVLGAQSRSPLNFGLLASVICYYIVKYCYLRTRNRRAYGVFAFVDKNMLAMIWCICVSIVVGIILSFVWPYAIKGLGAVFAFIADDITNPFNLFIYGITERFASMLNMVEIPRSVFWFGEAGGSWLDSFGRKFVGDVSIWTAQVNNSAVSSGIGRFITPLYVIQLFAIPGYLVAMFTLYTNRFEKRKYMVFLIISILISMFMGSSAPFDIFMFCTAPLLFMLHVFFCGVLYASLQWSKVYIGYLYSGSALLASPGSFADLMVYLKSPTMFKAVQVLFGIGIFVFVLYFFATKIYYRYLAIDMFQSGEQKTLVNNVVEALGGIENIRLIDSNPLKILVQVHDEAKVDILRLRILCNSKVFESKTGFVLYFYKASHALHVDIRRMINEMNALKESEN